MTVSFTITRDKVFAAIAAALVPVVIYAIALAPVA